MKGEGGRSWKKEQEEHARQRRSIIRMRALRLLEDHNLELSAVKFILL
jgi:hypothetical protein